jgi:hypothetical protein
MIVQMAVDGADAAIGSLVLPRLQDQSASLRTRLAEEPMTGE